MSDHWTPQPTDADRARRWTHQPGTDDRECGFCELDGDDNAHTNEEIRAQDPADGAAAIAEWGDDSDGRLTPYCWCGHSLELTPSIRDITDVLRERHARSLAESADPNMASQRQAIERADPHAHAYSRGERYDLAQRASEARHGANFIRRAFSARPTAAVYWAGQLAAGLARWAGGGIISVSLTPGTLVPEAAIGWPIVAAAHGELVARAIEGNRLDRAMAEHARRFGT